VLGRRRFRIRPARDDRPGDVSAESGHLRETGNLVFHISLLGVIAFVGVGHLWGWRGEVILAEGETFTSSVARYNTLQPGPWVGEDRIDPFVLTLDRLDVSFETEATGPQFGAPREFRADVTTAEDVGGAPVRQELAVNQPLNIDGTSVYLLGNGYAPVVTVRDEDGEVLYSQATPFLPQDDFYSSTGAVKVPAAEPDLGLHGAFLPTLRFDEDLGPVSDFPGLVSPGLVLTLYEGDLFPEGRPQSVYSLDVSGMTQVRTEDGEPTRLLLRPGETLDLPGGRGSVTLDGVVRWGGLVMREDPGRVPVLVSAIVMLAGLTAMLSVRRRRVFVRVTPGGDGGGRHTEVEVAGLAKGSDPSLGTLVDEVLEEMREQLGPVRAADLTTKDGR
jgi:cytochrome c biogenesis protein